MKFYSILIASAITIFSIVNIIVTDTPAWFIILALIADTALVIFIDGIEAYLLRKLPEKWFTYKNKFFNVGKKEAALYAKLGVRKWKDWLPDLGVSTGFRKDKLGDSSDNKYIERFILECNYGVFIHLVNIVTGFLILLLHPLFSALKFGLPVAIVNVIMSFMPTMALRYNTKKLLALQKFNEKNKARKDKKQREAKAAQDEQTVETENSSETQNA